LRPSAGGFVTPEFDGRRIRVDGTLLVDERPEAVATQEITTIRDAAEFLSGGYREVWYEDFKDPLEPMDPDAALSIESTDTTRIGDWFLFGARVLRSLGDGAGASDDVSEVQIWPEHFDAANEIGSAEESKRASYGASPGDDGIPEPYMYVAPWYGFDEDDAYWNASHFSGSALTHSELAAADDPDSAALDFLREGYRKLIG
jgi:hypothetical protein